MGNELFRGWVNFNKALDKPFVLKHKGLAAVCGGLAGSGRLKRGDLGQLAPRKKLLKSFTSFPENFLRPSEHSLAGGIFVLSLRAAP
jgi:hypothetical protein